jgi:hypothetical protein
LVLLDLGGGGRRTPSIKGVSIIKGGSIKAACRIVPGFKVRSMLPRCRRGADLASSCMVVRKR